jgi:hypothetical protein
VEREAEDQIWLRGEETDLKNLIMPLRPFLRLLAEVRSHPPSPRLRRGKAKRRKRKEERERRIRLSALSFQLSPFNHSTI